MIDESGAKADDIDGFTDFIRTIKDPIRENANNALLIRFISIPSFNKRPITLNGMPNLIRDVAIYLADEPKPGDTSVQAISLSIVLGTAIQHNL